ncbi:flagellar biosynthesis anti-sigma factor FlgM [Rhizorhabdus wittichii]|uniref:Negative regulator of flagellin synthesis n=1 Tax=Rhizorhabdus wittichii TaxID=160791 RepID=A0A975HFG8_9SPHN|nr:flagellar biosynthesis anti-sigma factor FlgM [Rhizorhabdus wittichii]QTH21899.1 flagellar biosynthesis anti-sigma factor FlgM [Rhizorhabdus wittichii]
MVMINGVGQASPTRIGQVKDETVKPLASPAPVESTGRAPIAAPSLVAALAEAGPPVNSEKIAAIRQAIASGQYPIDAKAIAAKMIALDLPGTSK